MKESASRRALYVLAASIVLVSFTNSNTAQSHTADSAKIRSIESQVASLKRCLNSNLDSLFHASASGSKDWRYYPTRC